MAFPRIALVYHFLMACSLLRSLGLQSSDYVMNQPRLLEKTVSPTTNQIVGIGQKISNYQFFDDGHCVEILVSIDGWDWRQVSLEEISIHTGEVSLTVNISSAAFGHRHLQVSNLSAEITKAEVRKKTSKRLTLVLNKKVESPWGSLIAARTRSSSTDAPKPMD